MAEFKLVIGNKDGKSYQIEVKDKDADVFLGKAIGDKVKGDDFGLAGYELEISGGSDYAGFPMRRDVEGASRKKILSTKTIGIKKINRKGGKKRKTVCGNTIHTKTSQINLKVVKEGAKKLEELHGKKEEVPAEKKEEAGKEKTEEKKEVKEEAGKEKRPEPEKKEEKPSNQEKGGEGKEKKEVKEEAGKEKTEEKKEVKEEAGKEKTEEKKEEEPKK